MSFRVATLNLARHEKRWESRRELIVQQYLIRLGMAVA
jgi:hypothetical protein